MVTVAVGTVEMAAAALMAVFFGMEHRADELLKQMLEHVTFLLHGFAFLYGFVVLRFQFQVVNKKIGLLSNRFAELCVTLNSFGSVSNFTLFKEMWDQMKKLKKLIISASVMLGMVTGLTAMTAAAADPMDVQSETDVAGSLGILQGDGSGLTPEYLNKPTTRLQAAIMYLRLKGLESEALAYTGNTVPFQDAGLVYKEGQSVLAYLKAHPELGWQGTGGDMFEPLAGITPQAYYKVLLESLGYKQGTDFEYDQVLKFAADHGLSKIAGVEEVANLNIATATIEALHAQLKGSGMTLSAQLAAKGIIPSGKLDVLTYPALQVKQNASAGSYLADAKGMTLYYFTKDVADMNSCTGDCLANWPVYSDDQLLVPAGFKGADFSSFVRKDGKKQVTYKGWPLYYFAKDQKPGDTFGEGVGKVW